MKLIIFNMKYFCAEKMQKEKCRQSKGPLTVLKILLRDYKTRLQIVNWINE